MPPVAGKLAGRRCGREGSYARQPGGFEVFLGIEEGPASRPDTPSLPLPTTPASPGATRPPGQAQIDSSPLALSVPRRGAGVVERGGLENR